MMTDLGHRVRQNWPKLLLVLLLATFVLAYLLLHTTPSRLESAEALRARLTDGQPTLVEFYSNL